MKKLKNKFILGVFFLVGIIFISQLYRAYYSGNIDTNSYLLLVKGRATLNEEILSLEEKYLVNSGDTIRTIGSESLAVLQWGDGSMTRLGGDTKISVEENQVSRDYSRINISFDLLAGKTWSNVVSFVGVDSYFTQTFDGVEAGVRGTVFDVDLERSFVNVSDHQVSLKKDNKEYLISENQTFSLQSFSLIELSAYIENLRDDAWVQINQNYDTLYVSELQKRLSETLGGDTFMSSIIGLFSSENTFLSELKSGENPEKIQELFNTFSPEQKEKLLSKVMAQYQKLNFVKPDDTKNYETKIAHKKVLIELLDTPEKETLLQYSLYDLQDSLLSGNAESLKSTLSLLNENTDILKNLNFDFLNTNINLIPDEIEFQSILDILSTKIPQVPDIDISGGQDFIKSATKDVTQKKKEIEENIQQGLGTILDTLNQ